VLSRRPRMLWVVWLAVGMGVATAEAEDRMPIETSIRPLFAKAVKEGSAKGIYAGKLAALNREKFKSNDPVLVDIERLHFLKTRPDCARVRVVITQANVITPGATQPRDQRLAYQVNVCADGVAAPAGTK
jgi:hypothetical protein